jgi:hypothetical protein
MHPLSSQQTRLHHTLLSFLYMIDCCVFQFLLTIMQAKEQLAATIDKPHFVQPLRYYLTSRTIESTISPPTKTAIISFELVEGRVAIMRKHLHYVMNVINTTPLYHSTSRTTDPTTMPPNRTTNRLCDNIRCNCAMIWSCNRRAGKGTAAGCYH